MNYNMDVITLVTVLVCYFDLKKSETPFLAGTLTAFVLSIGNYVIQLIISVIQELSK